MQHYTFNRNLHSPYPKHLQRIVFGMGCFWGVERLFYQTKGVYLTAAGYSGGDTENPTYEQVCSGTTNHTEVVQVIFDESVITFAELLTLFWENHDPTQGNRQGNDVGSQYRSAIYTTTNEQFDQAVLSRQSFQQSLNQSDYANITTEIAMLKNFYFAEQYHQQYLAKNPNGYCNLKGLGVCYQTK